jgi:predicted metal-dependent peptidase
MVKERLNPFEAAKRPMAEFSKEELQAVEDKIRQGMFVLLLNHEFFGIVALRLKRDITDRFPTAAVDGRTIYFNPGFVQALTLDEVVFLIAHEVWHCMFEHFLRRDGRKPSYWNMAGDYVINYLCKRDRIGKLISNTLYDEKFKNLTTEEVYEKLMESGAAEQDTLDVHIDIDENGNVNMTDGDGNPVKISPEEAKAIKDEIRASMIQAAKAAGNVPGEIKRMIDDFLKPQVDWRGLLETSIAAKIPYDTSFRRPDRKSWSNSSGIVFPGVVNDDTINLAIGIDNSGSFSNQQLKEALSEVRGIMGAYNEFKIKLWCFDTRVSGYAEFDQYNIDDILNYEFTGGGGTHIKCNYDYMLDEKIEADMLVIFTDLECYSLKDIDPMQIDTVWIIHGGGYRDEKLVPPFGKYAYYESGKKGS